MRKDMKMNLDIVACYKLLEECIDFEHIEDKAFICKNLELVKKYKKDIPQEVFSNIENFICEEIRPILENENYFDFIQKPEFGHYNKHGNFEINSESSLETMIFLMYVRCLVLNEKLLKLFSNYV